MNSNNTTTSKLARFSNTAKALAVSSAMVAGSAFAQAAGGFDQSATVSKITENTAIGVAVLGVFILGAWALKSMGLIGGKR